MTKVKAPSKANSSADPQSGRVDTKGTKTPVADKTTVQDRKKLRKAEKQLGEAAGDEARDKQHGTELCAHCNKEVLDGQNAVNCDGCGLWHHNNCEKVPEEVYAFLCAHNDPSVFWMCRKCTVTFQQLFSTVMRIDQAQKRLEEKFDAMMNKLEAANTTPDGEGAQKRLEDKVDAMMSKMENATTVPDNIQERVEEALRTKSMEDKEEGEEIHKRRNCVIIHGLMESTSEEAEDRMEDDCCNVASMMHELNCDDVSVVKTIRLGRRLEGPDVKPRPVKLILDTEENKVKVLAAAKNLQRKREGGWNKIFIHQDLTPRQRQARSVLVKEMKERQSKGERDLIIVNWKIVKRRGPRQQALEEANQSD